MWKAAGLALLLTACPGCDRTPPSGREPRQQLVLAYTVQPQSTLMHVAVAKGYCAEEGLDVRSVIQTHGKAALQTLLEHKADFATVAETPLMFKVLEGEPLCVVANIEASNLNNGIVARRDAGISAAADLKGKRIGFTPGTTSEFFLDSMLTALGLTRNDVHPVALKPEAMAAAIQAQEVDAVCTWNYPLTQIRRQLGDQGAIFFDREIYTETFNLVAQQSYVSEHPDTVRRLLRALLKAERYVEEQPEGARAILASATRTDPDIIREVWSAFHYQVRQDPTLLITLEDETRWAMKHHLTPQRAMPDYRKFIHLDSLLAVKPEAVTLNR
jgi:NitT/TauT family transport system substrate-binding protein